MKKNQTGLDENLLYGVEHNITPLVQVSLFQGANPNYTDEYGNTALHKVQTPQIAKTLIDTGANVNHGDIEGSTPLFTAQSAEVANILLSNGENPVLPHEKAPQSDATRAMAEFQTPEGENTTQMPFTNNTRMS